MMYKLELVVNKRDNIIANIKKCNLNMTVVTGKF